MSASVSVSHKCAFAPISVNAEAESQRDLPVENRGTLQESRCSVCHSARTACVSERVFETILVTARLQYFEGTLPILGGHQLVCSTKFESANLPHSRCLSGTAPTVCCRSGTGIQQGQIKIHGSMQRFLVLVASIEPQYSMFTDIVTCVPLRSYYSNGGSVPAFEESIQRHADFPFNTHINNRVHSV